MRSLRDRLGVFAAGIFALGAACATPTDEESTGPGISLTIVSGGGQSGFAGQELSQPLVVKATDNAGRILKGYLVTFRVSTGGGRMYSGTSLTDGRGIAQDYWTLGPTGGVQQVDVVAVDPLSGVKQNFGVFTATSVLATPVPVLSITPLSHAFGPTGVGVPSAGRIFTVSNTGGAASGTASVQVTGANAGDFAVSANTCTGAIPAGASCTFTVTFTPSALGSRTATVGVNASPGGSLSVPLSGEGAAAALLLISTGSDFGQVEAGGSSTDQVFTVTNAGGAASGPIVTYVSGSHPGDVTFSTDQCVAVNLAPGATCEISVRFSPGGSGVRTALLNASATPGGNQQAGLSGTGLAPAALSITPNSFSFGAVKATGTASVEQIFTVTNIGGSPTQALPPPVLTNAVDFDIDVSHPNGCEGGVTVLMAGASCEVKVIFDPASVGLRTGRLEVSAPNVVTVSAALAGLGAEGAELDILPDQVLFGTVAVGGEQDETLTIANLGDMSTGPISIQVSGANGSDFVVLATGSCAPSGTVLVPGGTCTVVVRFSPGATGARTATLTVTDGGTGQTANTTLTGTGN